MKKHTIGLGCPNFDIAVYIANRPLIEPYPFLASLHSLSHDEIAHIGKHCGNGWRKVFNVYAKLLYSLDNKHFAQFQTEPTWQAYRDKTLLQTGSGTALLFSAPILKPHRNTIHIICGRTYANELQRTAQINSSWVWLNDEFAIDKNNKVIVCPYFDYRQLSNIKIEFLAQQLLVLTQTLKGSA
ncbi:DUF6942 family protein [Pseudoalteromonas tunicata]|uniref:DUF6942 family protein n=1 Tax=Pseudoalteromonas tunicata TaxID=314281 RepID=UPI00273E775A|nr:hypothetical protein [Pseudoalteromonas tunicata]MDP4983664.1 hypothetical protein [Pseudoalteromonas tunicata]